MGVHDPRVDAYIARQREFARPILTHLREVIHSACPTAVETIKWGAPFFLYRDQMMCHMGAFKAHAALGFWKAAMIEGLGAKPGGSSAGNFGRLTSVDDLPSRKALTRFVKAAMRLGDDLIAAPKKNAAPKKAVPKPKPRRYDDDAYLLRPPPGDVCCHPPGPARAPSPPHYSDTSRVPGHRQSVTDTGPDGTLRCHRGERVIVPRGRRRVSRRTATGAMCSFTKRTRNAATMRPLRPGVRTA